MQEQYFENAKYFGQQINGKRNGKGKIVWNDGRVYFGDLVDDKQCGKGVFVKTAGDDQFIYEGEYLNDERHGQGVLILPDGNKYVGQFVNGKQSGQGIYTWPDGRKYVGQMGNNNTNGLGIITMPDGSSYNGQWKDGKMHGECIFTDKNRNRFNHRYVNGIQLPQNNQQLETMIKELIPTEVVHLNKLIQFCLENDTIAPDRTSQLLAKLKLNTYAHLNDAIFEALLQLFEDSTIHLNKSELKGFCWNYFGQVQNGKMNGKGKLILEDGRVYFGDFIDGDRSGNGVWAGTAEGEQFIYEGEWVNDKKNGHGIWLNGCSYDGQWKDDKQHGDFIYTVTTGQRFRERWENGECKSSEKIQ